MPRRVLVGMLFCLGNEVFPRFPGKEMNKRGFPRFSRTNHFESIKIEVTNLKVSRMLNLLRSINVGPAWIYFKKKPT